MVKESFNEYKKTIDKALLGIGYLYSDDINFSIPEKSYSEIKDNPSTSPSVIIKCIEEIYKDSFNLIKERSIEVVIPDNGCIDINDLLYNQNKYFFTSKSSYKFIGKSLFFSIDNKRGLPGYFYDISANNGYKIYYSPEVEEEEDSFTIYATDKPFQSLVYALQNMEYKVSDYNDRFIHEINYTLYNCNFTSYKFIIKNLTKMRNDKLIEILG